MVYRNFPKSEFKISVLGFGTAPIGLSGYQDKEYDQKNNEKESTRALEKALELGVNYFDTAPVYGNKIKGDKWPRDRASEKMLGEVLSKVDRAKIFLATKTFVGFNDPKNIRSSFDDSLRLLRTDYIDLYQIHGQSYRADNWKDLVTDDAIDILNNLKQAGKINFIGVSGYREGAFCAMIKRGIVDAVMPQYNIFYRSAEWELLKLAHDNKVAVLPMRPATGGKIVQFIDTIDPKYVLKIDPYKVALQYVISNSSVTAIPVGMRNVHEVEHNVALIEELKEYIP